MNRPEGCMLMFLFVLYIISVVQIVCAYRFVFGLFWGKIGMDNSLICLSSILARVNYNVLSMCSCMYSLLWLQLFNFNFVCVYDAYNSSSVCVWSI